MTSYSREDNLIAPGGESRQRKALQGMLDLLHSWQKKGVSRTEVKESIGHLLSGIQEKMMQDPSQVNLGELFALLLKPGHFSRDEKELIQAVFSEAAKLKKKLDRPQNEKPSSTLKKNRYRRPVDKKYI